MKSRTLSITCRAVVASLLMLGLRIPVSQAQALFFAFPEQVTTYNNVNSYDGIAPAAGAKTVTTTTTASNSGTVSLAPAYHTAPPDSIDSRVNAANDVTSVRNGARSDN